MQLTVNQHFVPQFYLRNWCAENGELWSLDKERGKHRKRGPRRVACADYAYDTKLTLDISNPKTLQFFEKEFSRLESIAKSVFDAVIRKARQISTPLILPISAVSILEIEVQNLCFFAALQMLRDEQFRDDLRNSLNLLYKRLWDETAPLLFENDDEDISFQTVSEDYVKHYQMEFLATRLALFEQTLAKKIVIVGHNSTNTALLTSDSPVLKTGFVLDWAIPWDGLNSPSSLIVYPMAPDVAIIFLDRDFYVNQRQFDRRVTRLTADDVTKFNRHQTLQSHKHIFSSKNDFAPAKAVLAEKLVPGKHWPIPPAKNRSNYDNDIEILKQYARAIPKGTYTKSEWLSKIQQDSTLPFGKLVPPDICT